MGAYARGRSISVGLYIYIYMYAHRERANLTGYVHSELLNSINLISWLIEFDTLPTTIAFRSPPPHRIHALQAAYNNLLMATIRTIGMYELC